MSQKYPRCEVEHARNIIKQGHFERAKKSFNIWIYDQFTTFLIS